MRSPHKLSWVVFIGLLVFALRRPNGSRQIGWEPVYFRSTAVSVISGTLAKAFDSGQSCFAPAAIF